MATINGAVGNLLDAVARGSVEADYCNQQNVRTLLNEELVRYGRGKRMLVLTQKGKGIVAGREKIRQEMGRSKYALCRTSFHVEEVK